MSYVRSVLDVWRAYYQVGLTPEAMDNLERTVLDRLIRPYLENRAALAEVVLVDNLHCLMVAGIILAMETDICRDHPDGSTRWTRQMLCDAAARINGL